MPVLHPNFPAWRVSIHQDPTAPPPVSLHPEHEEPILPSPGAASPSHRQSVADLVRAHNASLHAFLMARTGNEAEAREVAQEAYVRMLQLDQPGAVSYLRGYLFKTAANIVIDRARERASRARLLQQEAIDEPLDELSPDRYALGGEDIQVLRQALTELPEKLRRSFMLRHIDGCSDQQIGEAVGVSARMVRTYLTQAGVYCELRVQGHTPAAAKEAMR